MMEAGKRSTITVTRHTRSCGSYLIGTDVFKILSSVPGISAVRVELEFLDGAYLSYTSNGHAFDVIDRMLAVKGLHRTFAEDTIGRAVTNGH